MLSLSSLGSRTGNVSSVLLQYIHLLTEGVHGAAFILLPVCTLYGAGEG